MVFALLVAGIGCQRGFQVRGGAEAVGSATTSAVVAGIFLIIVTDSAFALVLHYYTVKTCGAILSFETAMPMTGGPGEPC